MEFYLFIFNVFEALGAGQRKQHFQYQPPFYFILRFCDFGSIELMASLCFNGFSELNSSIGCLKRKKNISCSMFSGLPAPTLNESSEGTFFF